MWRTGVCLCAGSLIGEDANQALQADINADPSTRLVAATLYRDNSGWLARVHSTHSAKSAEAAEGALGTDTEGKDNTGEMLHDIILEVEDGGLEGGQEGVAEGTPIKHEEADTGASQPASSPEMKVDVEEEDVTAGASEQQTADQSASVAIFVADIAASSNANGKDDPAAQLLQQDQAVPGAAIAPSSSQSAGAAQNNTQQDATEDANQDLLQQQHSEAPDSGPVNSVTAEAATDEQQPPPVQTFIVLCRENGLLQIFQLPDMKLLFTYHNAVEGPPLLTPGGFSPPQPEGEEARVHVVEARMESFGPRDASGYLFLCECLGQ